MTIPLTDQGSAYLWIMALSAVSFLASSWLTGMMRRYALSRQMVDEVNERSSHKTPTPRGGGLPIVVIALLAILVCARWFGFPANWATGFIGSGILVGAVGWVDDHGHVSAIVRFVTHLSAAAWAIFWVGVPGLEWLGIPPAISPVIGWVLGILAVGWLVNLFNFMDGIDGLAASEAACVTLGGALLLAGATQDIATALPFILLSAAALGFLRWNWPPARIFMGDASSGFLGLASGVLVLAGWQINAGLGLGIAILPGVFVADATVTLFRRIARRERVQEAHRTHAYQHLALRLGRHLPVTLGSIAITCLYLFPVAWLTSTGFLEPLAGLAVAYVPLIICAFAFGAGRAEKVVGQASASD